MQNTHVSHIYTCYVSCKYGPAGVVQYWQDSQAGRQTDRQMQWLPEAEYKESENVQRAKACRPKLSDTQCNGRHGNKLRGFPYSQKLWQ